ncbi:uncharacterized protein PHALS_11385 [Plasmopara halstedii]|uniref:Uncharacterized protein n=1 Tax=Plasmopara halstedii TaxID=4781 RepID=A0A0N7L3C7_PLAHL|nr:uncharacterized protein PHALS_11385 [Plasmopara halstedii]CEG35507.1 hypothetical protein PHALS_11385 [Plasmopara halstedii]|eukprot:XP_024571876.1 hypothetical protein PHALS_11385 [Plasmopara halstedii]
MLRLDRYTHQAEINLAPFVICSLETAVAILLLRSIKASNFDIMLWSVFSKCFSRSQFVTATEHVEISLFSQSKLHNMFRC